MQATDEAAAEALAKDVFPKAFAMVANDPTLKPVTERIQGQQVAVFQFRDAVAVCVGRQGRTLVLGPDREMVAESLGNGAKKGGLLTSEKAAAAIRQMGEPVALVVMRPAALVSMYYVTEHRGEAMKAVPQVQPVPVTPPPPPPAPTQGSTPAEILKLLQNEEPLVIGITRKPDRLQVEARYGGLRTMVPKLIDAMLVGEARASTAPAPR
jgi:hypothetical protein